MATSRNYTPLKINESRKDDLANNILLLISTISAAILALLLFLLIKKNL